jgi:DNA-binding IclR family transcriptional regulator
MSNTLQSVDRALRILLSFEREEQEVTVGEVAALLNVHKSTASRLVATLRTHGLLERAPGGDAFRLGPELARLGNLALSDRDLVGVARRPMDALGAATGETVTLSVLHGDEMTTVAQVDSRYVVGPQNWIGRRTPIHATSDGKVFLAFGDVPVPPGPLRAVTDRTQTKRAELQRELEQIRQRGFATVIGEFEYGLNSAAAPVIDASGTCRAALAVSGPAYRVTPKDLPRLGEVVRSTANEIGALLVTDSATEPTLGRNGRRPVQDSRPRTRTAAGGGRSGR